MSDDLDPLLPPSNRRGRRQRRLQERQTLLSLTSLFVIALVVGLGSGLYLSWLVFPVSTSASPAAFRQDFKSDYIYMVSQTYAADGNLPRAEERLALLADSALKETLRFQLETSLREGQPATAVRNLANLAVALGVEGTSVGLFGPGEIAVTATPSPSPTPTAIPPTPTLLPLLTSTPTPPPATSTPRPELEPTTEPNFRLLDQVETCRPADQPPLIVVVVLDPLLDDLPGAEVIVTWDDGEDRFITGFKTGQRAGYGDFAMSPDITYAVAMPDGSGRVGGLTTGPCELADGDETVDGLVSWTLTIQALTFE